MAIPAYCDFEYLLRLLDHPEKSGIGSDSKMIDFLHLRELMVHGADVKTEASKETIAGQLNNPYIKHLIKNNRLTAMPGDLDLLAQDERVYFESKVKEPAIYLMPLSASKRRLAELQERSGCYFLGHQTASGSMFQDRVCDLVARKFSSWAFLQEMLRPHHSLVIADPYLFTEKGLQACIRLLEVVIPKQLQFAYHISLLSATADGYGNGLSADRFKTLKEAVESTVKKQLTSAVIEWHTIHKQEFHDRIIISNNTMIYAGSGIDAINAKGEATRDSYWVSVTPFKRVIHNGEQGAFGYKMIHSKLNRLKEWIKQSDCAASHNPLFS